MTQKKDQPYNYLRHSFFNHLVKVTGISVLSFMLTACDSQQENAAIAPPLRLVKVRMIAEPSQFQFKEFPGVVDAVQKAELAFRVSGKLEKLQVKEGDIVSQDQVLARLDDKDYRIQLNSREAEYKQVHADYLRARKLVDSGAISRSDFNKLQAQNSTALANLASAKQTLGYTSLKAPFAGRIAKRYVENFEDVSAMQAVYLLQDTSSLTIKVNLPSSLMIKIRKEAQSEINAFFDTIPGQKFPLKPLEISTQADEATNTYQVTLGMEAVDGYNILPGMSVTVRGRRDLDNETDINSFYLPAQSVLSDDEGRYVYLAVPSGEGLATVERRKVETGKLSERGLEVLSGVNTGESLIIAGMSKMYPGLEVRLSKESSL